MHNATHEPFLHAGPTSAEAFPSPTAAGEPKGLLHQNPDGPDRIDDLEELPAPSRAANTYVEISVSRIRTVETNSPLGGPGQPASCGAGVAVTQVGGGEE